jgi:hypothetical protein
VEIQKTESKMENNLRDEFEKTEMRVGTVIEVSIFPKLETSLSIND